MPASPQPLSARVTEQLIRHHKWLLIIAVALSIPAALIAPQLQTDDSIHSFFAADDPLRVSLEQSREWFGGDEFVLLAFDAPLHELSWGLGPWYSAWPIVRPFDLGSERHLDGIAAFVKQLNAVPGVRPESTQSLDTLLRPQFKAQANRPTRRGGVFARLAQRKLARVYASWNQEELLEFGEHIVVSEDRRTIGIVLRLEPSEVAPVPRSETIRQIRELAAAHDPPAVVAGEPVQVQDMFRYVDEDSRTLGWTSSLLLIVVILTLFRSLRWVILPVAVVQITLLWTKAILVELGIGMSIAGAMLVSLVTIVGIATVTHVTVKFREFRSEFDRQEALRRTLAELLPPIFWTCMTTAIGFGSLLVSEILPIYNFGIMLGIASILTLVCCLLLIPGGVLLFPADSDPRSTPAEGALLRVLRAITHSLERRPLTYLVLFGLVMAVTSAGLLNLRVETDFSKNFRDSSPIVQALDYFESRMGGAGNWEVLFDTPETLTDESLEQVRELTARLRQIELADGTRLTKVVSLTDGLDFAPGSNVRERRERISLIQPEFVPSLYNSEAGTMRIVLRSMERQPAETKLQLIDEVQKTSRELYPEARATGLYVLLANLISSILSDQLSSFLIATAGIFVCLTIAFRSLWIGAISLLPNLFPLVVVIGGMGWSGLPINIGTAMIASVSMGLTVDATIHYLNNYQLIRRQGLSHVEAVRATHTSVGRALVFAHLVLVAGFLVLTLSNFIPLVYFGALVSLSMLGGLIGTVFLLPLLLRWIPFPVSPQGSGSSAVPEEPLPTQAAL